MSTPDTDGDVRGAVAIELERLRHSLDVGLTAIRGDLALLLQRADQHERRMGELEERVTVLEGSRWPLPAIATLAALAAAITGVIALSVR